jgi:hypothetical protein
MHRKAIPRTTHGKERKPSALNIERNGFMVFSCRLTASSKDNPAKTNAGILQYQV